jgi:competence protein ComEC
MKLWKYTFTLLLLVLAAIAIGISQLPDDNLHIIACDVGQGDAILVTYKNIQILTDGGPNSSVLDCLGRHIPFWDRDIELVISTHPDADHSTGLVDVIKRYNVDKILINPVDPGTDIYRLLESAVGGRGVEVVNPSEGMGLRLGLIHLDILGPSDEFLNKLTVKSEGDKLSKYSIGKETNLYSIVYKLSFKKFGGLFLGDIPKESSDQLAARLTSLRVNYIKIPHHGSANGLTQNLLEKIVPEGGPSSLLGVISVSAKNMWGFPAPEILTMLSNYNVRVLRTDQMGDVEVITDGDKIWWKN